MRFRGILLFIGIKLSAASLPFQIAPQGVQTSMGVRILDQQELLYKKIDKEKFTEISAAAYDAKKRRLYLISDSGRLYLFEAVFSEKASLKPIGAAALRNEKGKRLLRSRRDSEGAALDAKGRLWVSFEGKKPKIVRVGTSGKKRGKILERKKLPKYLSRKKYYRGKNKALESLTYHPLYGLLTAPERPLRKTEDTYHTIYSLKGKKWRFRAYADAGLVGMETAPDGKIITLERYFERLTARFVIVVKEVDIERCDVQKICKAKTLALLDTEKGWSLDNFETIVRVGKNRYVIISDDNDLFIEKTLLLYFEVI